MNNLEIIIENVKSNDLDKIIFEELHFDKQKIISSKAFPEIAKSGAVVVGKGKGAFPGGTQIPPTEVKIVRP